MKADNVIEPDKPKTCKTCEGEKETYFSCCTGDLVDSDFPFCPVCKEHLGLEVCEWCNGTGIETFTTGILCSIYSKEKWKYLKFWFSADKEYITRTATNGVTYGDGTSPYRYDRTVNISYGSISASGWWVESNITLAEIVISLLVYIIIF